MTVLDQESQVVKLDEWDKYKNCRAWSTSAAYGCVPNQRAAIRPSCRPCPGVVTQGETVDETLENVKEAFRGVVAEYAESKQEIPWCHDIIRQKPHDAIEKWILVNV